MTVVSKGTRPSLAASGHVNAFSAPASARCWDVTSEAAPDGRGSTAKPRHAGVPQVAHRWEPRRTVPLRVVLGPQTMGFASTDYVDITAAREGKRVEPSAQKGQDD